MQHKTSFQIETQSLEKKEVNPEVRDNCIIKIFFEFFEMTFLIHLRLINVSKAFVRMLKWRIISGLLNLVDITVDVTSGDC